jgi:hypothetical protein
MKITDLRKAVEIMDENQILALASHYEQMGDICEGYYARRLAIVEQEMEKDHRPKVNRRLAQQGEYWKSL